MSIVHWNRPQECIATVKMFLAQNIPLEISVIDNCSSQENFTILKENLPSNVTLIRLEENQGWGVAHNIVLEKWLETDKSPYCFISAHDSLPEPDCLKMLLESMNANPSFGMLCPQYKEYSLPKYSPLKFVRFVPSTAPTTGKVEEIDFPHGTLIVYRKKCIQEIGLYDKRYFAYGDEIELGLRARLHKWKVGILSGAVLTNPISGTPKAIVNYLIARNSLLMAKKYGGLHISYLRALLILFSSFKKLFSVAEYRNFKVLLQSFFYPRYVAVNDYLNSRYGLKRIF